MFLTIWVLDLTVTISPQVSSEYQEDNLVFVYLLSLSNLKTYFRCSVALMTQ